MPLFSNGRSIQDALREDWKVYWREEVRSIAEVGEIARAILAAVSHENADEGYRAEDRLLELLNARYSGMPDTR